MMFRFASDLPPDMVIGGIMESIYGQPIYQDEQGIFTVSEDRQRVAVEPTQEVLELLAVCRGLRQLYVRKAQKAAAPIPTLSHDPDSPLLENVTSVDFQALAKKKEEGE